MPTNLAPESIRWALKHIARYGDGDLFPHPFEFQILAQREEQVVEAIASIDLDSHQWMAGRRMLIPKDSLHHRAATQLEPIDTILLVATIKQYGQQIEAHRLPSSSVFSYRFLPEESGRMYSKAVGWREFWSSSAERATQEGCQYVVRADISDFYNQIYHHVLENQLAQAGVPASVVKALVRFAGTTTQKVSRGLPVGPHFVHLLAELSLCPCDRALIAKGLRALRYVDDYHVLVNNKEDARVALQLLAETLDSQQKLALQSSKTSIMPIVEFVGLAERLGDDLPRTGEEEEVLNLIRERTEAGPYMEEFDMGSLSDKEKQLLGEGVLRPIIEHYLEDDPVDYWRLSWILRRLAQTGSSGALAVVLENIGELVPIMGAVARYILNCSSDEEIIGHDLGGRIARAVGGAYISKNKYIQMVLINVLAMQPQFDNVETLTARYEKFSPEVRREVLLAAWSGDLVDWIREQKGQLDADPWLRRALIRACSSLPADERQAWVKTVGGRLVGLDRFLASVLFADALRLNNGFRF